MKKNVGIGHQDFEVIRKEHCFYIDKTQFIEKWWKEKDVVTLITRPRRFGKTLNVSMIEAFFSVQYKDREDLFEGLKIWEKEDFRDLQGTYPVINLSFANIKETDYENARRKICQILSNLYSEYEFLLDSSVLGERGRRFFELVSEEMDDTTATMAIHQLSLYLSKYYGIYNPWSILNYLDKKQFAPYWANSSSNSLVDKLVRKGSKDLKTTFQSLLTGEAITAELDEQIVYDQLYNDEQAVWSLLLASVYLKVKNLKTYTTDFGDWKQEYQLALTNFEVRLMFRNMVRKWFSGALSVYNDFIRALLLGDIKAMNIYMNRVAMATFSYFDTGKKSFRRSRRDFTMDSCWG